MTFRKQQIESVLKRTISELLIRKISDPRIVGLVSITAIDASPDLSRATVWVSVLPQEHEKTTTAGLNHAAPYIHGLLRKSVTFRTVPHLDFRLDHDLKKQSSVMAAISKGVSREKPIEDDETAVQQTLDEQNDKQHNEDQLGRGSHERTRREAGRAEPQKPSEHSEPSDTAGPAGQESSK